MYIHHTNPIALRTQHMISDALIRLMQSFAYQQITITQLCDEAAVGRKTFYRHFQWKEDVIAFQLDQLYEQYENELQSLSLDQYLQHHFSFLRQHMDYLILLYNNDLQSMLTARFNQLQPMVMPQWSLDPTEQAYRTAYIAAGIDSIVHTWVDRGFKESVEEITEIAMRMHEKWMLEDSK